MLDHLIQGVTVVDGTGAAAFVGDVGVRDGRIAVVAPAGGAGESARSRQDATGLVLAPGFVDPHTHYDAQLFWDPYATPSMSHGVTTVAGGNCGFTLAPLKAEDADYTRRMMCKVEGMSLAALEEGVPWSWRSFGDYLDALEGRTAVNAGFMVGHCALRRHVMGPDAVADGAVPTAAQMEEMLRLFHEAMDAGGWGLSTTQSSSHSDGDGRPVASRHARREELVALCAAVGAHEGTQIEAIVAGCLDRFADEEIDLLVAMTAASGGRPLNWNVLTIDSAVPDRVPRQLLASELARKAGGRIVALTMPVLAPMNMSLGTFCALNLIPGWGEILGLPATERIARLRDPAVRAEMLRRATSPEAGVFRRLTDFGRYVIGDTYSAANEGLTGRVVRDVAAERGQEPFQALVEVCAADGLRTVLWPMPTDNDPDSWELRRRTWDHEDVLLGGSDAGAHLDRMCGAPYTTRFIGDCLRGRKLVPMERAVRMLTDEPAQLFGLRDRGRIAEGHHADLVLFDPERIDAEPARLVHDLPGDSPRLDSRAVGVVSVRVGGVETIRDDQVTGAVPGTVLRSGRDTRTVTGA